MNTAKGELTKKAQIAAASNALIAILDKPARVIPTCGMSKSRFVAGMQCAKRLYLQVHRPHLAKLTNQGHLDEGTAIGVLARNLFPGGVLVDTAHDHWSDAVRITRELLNNSQVPAIFEATFVWDGVLVRVDVLRRHKRDEFRTIEVKSSTAIKPYHVFDLSIQQYVLRGAGIRVKSDHVMHVNADYVFDGGLELSKLFLIEEIQSDRLLTPSAISGILNDYYTMLSKPEPPLKRCGTEYSRFQVPNAFCADFSSRVRNWDKSYPLDYFRPVP